LRVFETARTDVLVIGAGAAGIRAALAASEAGARVTLLGRGPVTTSGSTFSSLSGGWGIQALSGPERTRKSLEEFYDEVIEAGLGLCDPKLVRILVEESGPRLEDLRSYGLLLRKDHEGKALRAKGCFSGYERAYLTRDMGNIRRTFQAMVRASRSKILIGRASELIVHEGRCSGAWILTPDRRIIRVTAAAVVLATGGGAGLFADHLVTDSEAGEGYVLAHGAGAVLKNLEFIQFMLGTKENGVRRFLPLSDLAEPGRLLDDGDRDVLVEYIPDEEDRRRAAQERTSHHPFSSRDRSRLIDVAVATARRAGRRVFWRGADTPCSRLEVVHLAHAFNGGAAIDERAETTMDGLFAAGEVAAGPHGADRIGGCMMTATQVFGERAGRFAAIRARQTASALPATPPPEELERTGEWGSGRSARELSRELFPLRQEAADRLSILRDEKGLLSFLARIEETKSFLDEEKDRSPLSAWSERRALTALRLIASHARERRETRGAHFRSDFPPDGNVLPHESFP
jgi:L-aspartate oxidase